MTLNCDSQLYAVALFAARGRIAADGEIAIPVEVEAWATPACSNDEAASLGLERARATWPESDGWQCHAVRVAEIKLIREAPTLESTMIEERIM